MKSLIPLVTFLFLSTFAHAQQYYTVPEVLAYLFPKAEKVGFEKKSLTPEQQAAVSLVLQDKDVRAEWTVYIATTNGKIDGYAIVDAVLGKEKPIIFVVGISLVGTVNEVEILEYRESHGGQVKNLAFRRQFVGKTASDPLKVGQDIRNVSGATISSKSVASGVKRALAVWRQFYAPNK